MSPLKISVKEKQFLYIKWSDESESLIKLANLRLACPCALCAAEQEERGLKYIPLYSDIELTLENISIVGNYALALKWGDKHNTGIYMFDYLKKLSDSH